MLLGEKVAIITGGGRGIGRAIAHAFATEGAAVVLAGRTLSKLEETVDLIKKKGGRAMAVRTDVSDEKQVERMVAETMSAFGRIDILVNNAGIIGPTVNVVDIDVNGWNVPHYAAAEGAFGGWRMFSLDASGPMLTTQGTTLTSLNLLVLTPGGINILNSAAVEDVLMLRDEPAEMAWGVERTVVGASGSPTNRALVWRTTQPLVAPPGSSAPAYRLGSIVPTIGFHSFPSPLTTVPCNCAGADCPLPVAARLGHCSHTPIRLCSSKSCLARESTWSAAIVAPVDSTGQPTCGSGVYDQRAPAKDAAGCASIFWISLDSHSVIVGGGPTSAEMADAFGNMFAVIAEEEGLLQSLQRSCHGAAQIFRVCGPN